MIGAEQVARCGSGGQRSNTAQSVVKWAAESGDHHSTDGIYLFRGFGEMAASWDQLKINGDGAVDRVQSAYGESRRKRSDTLVRTLRQEYGEDFAPGFRADTTLETLLRKENVKSLSAYLKRGRPIRVQGRFATARDAAKTLGVSKSRASELINVAKRYHSSDARGLLRSHRYEPDPSVPAAKKKIASAHAEFKTKKTKAKR